MCMPMRSDIPKRHALCGKRIDPNFSREKEAIMKKVVSLILALVMCLALVPSAFAADTADKFTDVPSDAWYKSELDYAVFNGYISGTSNTTFSPDSNVTRGQFITIFGKSMGDRALAPDYISADTIITNPFVDVSGDSYYGPYVIATYNKGIVKGTSSTTFSPDAPITVEQMGTILGNFITNWLSIDETRLVPADVYKDAAAISQWAKDGMEVMRKCDLLVVDANGNVNPQKYATRAECAVAIVRLAKGIGRGITPVSFQKSDTAEVMAKKVHDALWAAGKIKSDMTQYQKAYFYYDWINNYCEYDSAGKNPNRHTAYGAFMDGLAVCDGGTYAYNLLLETEGIECSMEVSYSHEHAWTSASLDGVLYHIDAINGIWMTPEEARDWFGY